MPDILSARQATTLRMKAGRYLQVSGSGEVEVMGAGSLARRISVSSTVQTIGPFSQPSDVAIRAGLSPLTYTLYPSGPQIVVVSAEAPSNADGRPDGTVYIQTA